MSQWVLRENEYKNKPELKVSLVFQYIVYSYRLVSLFKKKIVLSFFFYDLIGKYLKTVLCEGHLT